MRLAESEAEERSAGRSLLTSQWNEDVDEPWARCSIGQVGRMRWKSSERREVIPVVAWALWIGNRIKRDGYALQVQ